MTDSSAGSAAAGAFGSFFGLPPQVGSAVFSGLGGLLGFGANARENAQLRGDITDLTQFNPSSFNGGGFGVNPANGNVFMDQLNQALRGGAGAGALAGFGGGLFNNQSLQEGLGGLDFGGAISGVNNAFGQQASPFFNQGTFNQNAGNVSALGNMFASNVAGGPQDFSGGLQSSLFGQGAGNLSAAGDQSALFNQSLATQRAAAQPQQDRLFNRLQDRLFATGQLGSTGGSQQLEGFFNAANQQDLGFQNNAFGQAQQQQQFLAGLGQNQIGLGQNFLGQNLGQFNQNAGLAAQFAGLGGQLEGQGFGQQLGALQQNQAGAAGRLQNMQGLLGFGAGLQNQGFTQGLQGGGFLLDQAGFGRDTLINLLNAEANRIGATGLHAQALGSLGGSGSGGFLSGALGAIGGLFG